MKRYWYLSVLAVGLTAIITIGGCNESAANKAAVSPAPAAAVQPKIAENKPVAPAPAAPVPTPVPTPAPTPVPTPEVKPNVPAAPAAAAEPNKPTAPAAKAMEPNGIAVTVNGSEITEAQLEAKMAPRLKQMGGQVPPQYQEQMKKQLRGRALDQMIIEKLLDEKVKEKGITISDEMVDAELAKQMKQEGLTPETFKKTIEGLGLTEEQVKNQVRQGLGYQKLIEEQFAGKTDVNDQDAKTFYEHNMNEFKTPEQVRASHILISTKSTDPNADPNKVKAEAKAKADMILAKVNAPDANFAALAKEYSSCPSAPKGGDLGLFGRGQMVKPFEDAAFALKPGQVSGVVQTDFGYHIIKVTEHRDANTTSFEAAKPKIIEQLTNQKKSKLAQEYIKSLKDSAKIVYPPGKEPVAPPQGMPVRPMKHADANAAKAE